MPRVSAAVKAEKIKIKEKAQNMAAYLNRCEEILSDYSLLEQKEEKLAELGVNIGKCMVTFCELADKAGFFDEE